MTARMPRRLPIFDLDGTLLDSDEALVAPFLSLGVARDDIGFGEPVDEACRRLGVSTDDYVARYDAEPLPAVPRRRRPARPARPLGGVLEQAPHLGP